MFSYIILSAVLIALIPSASAQSPINLGSCSQEQVNEYIFTLPNSGRCVAASDVVIGGGSNIYFHLGVFCTRECGGAISAYLLLNCGEDVIPSVINAYLTCLPTNGTLRSFDGRCGPTLPGILDAGILTTLNPCASYNISSPDTCPTGCANALSTAVVGRLGCCFQAVYNDTILLSSYATAGALSASGVALINKIRYPMLWSACNMSLVPQCTSPYPRDPMYIVGTCTATDFGDFFSARSISQTCMNDITNLNRPLDFFRTPAGMQTLDRTCTQECGRPLRMFYDNTCHDETNGLSIENFCLPSNGRRGNRCRYVLDRSLATDPVILNLKNCFTFDPSDMSSTCPVACRNALSSLSSEFGCCYQNIYNATGYLDALVIDESITFEERSFWYGINNLALWNRCSVPLVQVCTGEPFCAIITPTNNPAGGAVKFIASFSVLLFVLVASFNL